MRHTSLAFRILGRLIVGVVTVLLSLSASLTVSSIWCSTSLAADSRSAMYDFTPKNALDGHIDFWILTFTKYGKNQSIFHDRRFPSVIFSVKDYSSQARSMSHGAFSAYRGKQEEQEKERIRESLAWLGSGSSPRNAFERKLVDLYRKLPGSSPQKFRDAASEPKRIRSQTGMKERFRESLERSGRYLYAIEQIFKSEGLPLELARIPFVESSFDYTAYSSVGAAGIWQFMRSTGKQYMSVTPSLDERRDPIIASRGAARYLASAYNSLGKWPLAVTSYNHGVGGIMRGVKTIGSSNLPELIRGYEGSGWGFASQNFYVSFLAALYVDQNAKKFFPDLVREAPVLFDEIRLERSTPFSKFCQAARTSCSQLEELNRGFMKPILTGRVAIPSGTRVKVPKGRGKATIISLGHGVQLPSFSSSREPVSIVNRPSTPKVKGEKGGDVKAKPPTSKQPVAKSAASSKGKGVVSPVKKQPVKKSPKPVAAKPAPKKPPAAKEPAKTVVIKSPSKPQATPKQQGVAPPKKSTPTKTP